MMSAGTVLACATPAFFALIGVELRAARLRGRRACRSNDAVTRIGLEVIPQLAGVFLKVCSRWVCTHGAWSIGRCLRRRPTPGGVWLSALLLYDFLYYWLHRMGHEVDSLWAAHVAHHQSEDHNPTAPPARMRQGERGASGVYDIAVYTSK